MQNWVIPIESFTGTDGEWRNPQLLFVFTRRVAQSILHPAICPARDFTTHLHGN